MAVERPTHGSQMADGFTGVLGPEMSLATPFTAKWQPGGSRVSVVIHGAVLSHSVKLLTYQSPLLAVMG